jgi:hypothetical protein
VGYGSLRVRGHGRWRLFRTVEAEGLAVAIIKNTLRNPATGGPLGREQITIKLVSGTTGGFIGSSVEILDTRTIRTDATGLWSEDLTPNALITPANTYYTVQQFGETLSFVVPNTAGPFWLLDILVQSPTSPSGLVVGVLASRQIIAGAGLTGGGDLTADRTLSVGDLSATYARHNQALVRPTLMGKKIRGGNITVKPSGQGWQGMWAEWDWTNWIKPQVDRAVALGMNTVRVIGSAECVIVDPIPVTLPKISQATYLARWQQLVEYCQSVGLYLYPVVVQKWDFIDTQTPTYNFQASNVTNVVTATAQLLGVYTNVIGFDCFQEGDATYGLAVADVLAMYSAIRAVAPTVPLTTSNSTGGFGTLRGFWDDTTSLSYQAWTATGGSDFIDIHLYTDALVASDLDGFIQRVGKPVLIGEFGDSVDQTTGAIAARYAAMAAVHNRQGVIGSLVWALADQTTTSTDEWGVWDNTGFSQPSFPSPAGSTPLSTTSGKRSTQTNGLQAFGLADLPQSYRSPNLLKPTQANPTGTSNGWTTGANTYLSATNLGVAVAVTAAGNAIASTTPSNGTPVTAVTPYIAKATFLASATADPRPVSIQIDWYNSSNAYISSSSATTGTDSLTAPLELAVVAISASTAAYAVVTVRVIGATVANENHLVNNISLRNYVAGESPSASYPASDISNGDVVLHRGPTTVLAVTIDRNIPGLGSLGLLTSGTPRCSMLGFAKPTKVTALHFVTGTTAAITPTHWWVAITDSAGVVVAVSADQLTAALAASTAFSVSFAVPQTLPAGRYYAALMVVAGTVPTLIGLTGIYNTIAIAPVTDSNSGTTGQTTAPALGATLTPPASQSASAPYFWVT